MESKWNCEFGWGGVVEWIWRIFMRNHDYLVEKWPNVQFLMLLCYKSSIFWIIWDHQWVLAPNSGSRVNIEVSSGPRVSYHPNTQWYTQYAHQIPISSTNIFKNPATNIVRGSSCIIWCIYHHHLLQNVLSVTLILINFFFTKKRRHKKIISSTRPFSNYLLIYLLHFSCINSSWQKKNT